MEINGKLYDMDVEEAAKLLEYHPQTVRDLARTGKLPALKRRHAWRFNKDDLMFWLDIQDKNYRREQTGDTDIENFGEILN